MNREIKFRAWDKYRGDKGIMLANHTFKSIALTGLHDDEHLIWMQYTGLKDQNGTELYEADICRCKMVGIDTHIEIVEAKVSHFHAESAFAFEVIGNESDYRVFAFNSRNILSVEIIGNEYENPELLKGGRS